MKNAKLSIKVRNIKAKFRSGCLDFYTRHVRTKILNLGLILFYYLILNDAHDGEGSLKLKAISITLIYIYVGT